MMPSRTSRVSAAGTSASGMWIVARTTLSGSDQNIIATCAAPVRWPSKSVWPFHGRPACENASLLTGAVAMASTRPACASATARMSVSYAALPDAADACPSGPLNASAP